MRYLSFVRHTKRHFRWITLVIALNLNGDAPQNQEMSDRAKVQSTLSCLSFVDERNLHFFFLIADVPPTAGPICAVVDPVVILLVTLTRNPAQDTFNHHACIKLCCKLHGQNRQRSAGKVSLTKERF